MADSKLTALPSGAAIADADLFYSSQSATSVKQAATALKTYAQTTAGATAFTAGSVVFAGASGVYSQDNAALNWNDSALQLSLGNQLGVPAQVVTAPLESPYIFFDNFPGAVTSLSGKSPVISTGGFTWAATGSLAANLQSGGGVFNVSSGTGQGYGVIQTSATPWEFGGSFKLTNSGSNVAMAVVKDYAGHGFTVMWHVLIGTSGIAASYWNDTWNGAGATVTNVAPQWATPANQQNLNTMTTGVTYNLRIIFNAPWVDYIITDANDVVYVSMRSYDPITASILGPNVFIEVTDTNGQFSQAYVRTKPLLPSLRYARDFCGLEATPIGINNPAAANFSSLIVGLTDKPPAGVFTVNYNGLDDDIPTILNWRTWSAGFQIKATAGGNQAALWLTNGGSGTGKVIMGGDYGLHLQGNSGNDFLVGAANDGTTTLKGSGWTFQITGGATKLDYGTTNSGMWSFAAATLVTIPSTVAGLPAAGTAGRRSFVTDGSVVAAGNFGTVVAGGGTNKVPVFDDGTNWRIG